MAALKLPPVLVFPRAVLHCTALYCPVLCTPQNPSLTTRAVRQGLRIDLEPLYCPILTSRGCYRASSSRLTACKLSIRFPCSLLYCVCLGISTGRHRTSLASERVHKHNVGGQEKATMVASKRSSLHISDPPLSLPLLTISSCIWSPASLLQTQSYSVHASKDPRPPCHI